MKYLFLILSLFVFSISSCKKEVVTEEFNPAFFYTKAKTVLLTEVFDNNNLGWDLSVDSSFRDSWWTDPDSLSFAQVTNGSLQLKARRGDMASAILSFDEQLISSSRFVCFDIEFGMFRNANLYSLGTSRFYFTYNGVRLSKLGFHDTYLEDEIMHVLYDTKLQKVYSAIGNEEAVEDEIFQVSNILDTVATPRIYFEAVSTTDDITGNPLYGDTDVKRVEIYTLK